MIGPNAAAALSVALTQMGAADRNRLPAVASADEIAATGAARPDGALHYLELTEALSGEINSPQWMPSVQPIKLCAPAALGVPAPQIAAWDGDFAAAGAPAAPTSITMLGARLAVHHQEFAELLACQIKQSWHGPIPPSATSKERKEGGGRRG